MADQPQSAPNCVASVDVMNAFIKVFPVYEGQAFLLGKALDAALAAHRSEQGRTFEDGLEAAAKECDARASTMDNAARCETASVLAVRIRALKNAAPQAVGADETGERDSRGGYLRTQPAESAPLSVREPPNDKLLLNIRYELSRVLMGAPFDRDRWLLHMDGLNKRIGERGEP